MSLIDDVKQSLSIVEVVGERVDLERLHTRNPQAPCPFHEERTPSFKLDVERQTWRCFGACQTGGDIFSFVMRADGLKFNEALDFLCEKAGIERTRGDSDREADRRPTKSEQDAIYEVNALAADYWHKQLSGSAGTTAREYLDSRGIDVLTAQRWGIGYAPGGSNTLLHYLKSNQVPGKVAAGAGLVIHPEGSGWRDMFLDRITFAICDRRGNIVGFAGRAMGDDAAKYLNTAETHYFKKSELLYGLDKAAGAVATTGRAVIVEGYMDVITAHENGYRNAVASMGVAVTPEQLSAVASVLHSSDSESAPEVVMCLDHDEAGQQATMRNLGAAVAEFRDARSQRRYGTSAETAQQIGIKIARPVMSEDGMPKDPDEAIRQDAGAWLSSIEGAWEIYEFAVESGMSRGDLDSALGDVEPYVGELPPTTVSGRKRLEWIASRMDLEFGALQDILLRRRAARQAAQGQSRPRNRSDARNGTSNGAVGKVGVPVRRSSAQFLKFELELAACLVQQETALDYAATLDTAHFKSVQLREIVDYRMRCASSMELAEVLSHDESLRSVYDVLVSHPVNLSSDDNGDADGMDAIGRVVGACMRRTREAHYRRCKREESNNFGNNGLPEDPAIRDEILRQANETNRRLQESFA